MSSNENFTFKNQATIEGIEIALKKLLEMPQQELWPELEKSPQIPQQTVDFYLESNGNIINFKGENRVLIEKALNIIQHIKSLDNSGLEYLDQCSIYSREVNKTATKDLFEEIAKDGSTVLHNEFKLASFLLLLALLSVDITYNYYTNTDLKMAHLGGPIRTTVVTMENFVNSYTVRDPGVTELENDSKIRVKYFAGAVQKYYVHHAYEQIEILKNKTEASASAVSDSLTVVKEIVGNFSTTISDVLKDSAHHLSMHFATLLKSKENSIKNAKNLLFLIGILATIPPVFLIIYNMCHPLSWENGYYISMSFFRIIAPAAIEGLLLYYFAVALQHFNALKTQRDELENRAALTGFLPGYAIFSEKNKDNPCIAYFSKLIFRPLSNHYKQYYYT